MTRKHLEQAATWYPDAARELNAWIAVVEDARWSNFNELRQAIPDADMVDGYVVFNVRHNRYRLVTVVHFAKASQSTKGHIYIRSFLTHREYNNRDNWDRKYGRT